LQRSAVLKRPAAVPGGFLRRAAALLLLTGALAPLLFAGGAGVWAWLFRVLSSLLTASTLFLPPMSDCNPPYEAQAA
jgi:hypothetical protein